MGTAGSSEVGLNPWVKSTTVEGRGSVVWKPVVPGTGVLGPLEVGLAVVTGTGNETVEFGQFMSTE